MKQSLSPMVILVAVAGLIVVVGGIFLLVTRSPAGREEGKSSGAGIPPEIQAQIQQQKQGGGDASASGGRPPGAPGSLMAPPGASGIGGR